jgi:hypothetical protein
MSAPGGFVEACASTVIRPRPTLSVPPLGPFTFPPPYHTSAVRLTNTRVDFGRDLLWPVGMSYWPVISAPSEGRLRVFLCFDRNRGGPGPSTVSVDLATGQVSPTQPLFSPEAPLAWATGESWYWSRRDPSVLYASDATRLYRVDVRDGSTSTVADAATLDPTRQLACWQWHSSADEQTHSCTVKDTSTDTWQAIGTAIYREAAGPTWEFFPKWGELDECQVDKSGRWLLIKDNVDAAYGEDNLIQDLTAAHTRLVRDEEGAAGHSDNGFGYMLAADNWSAQPGAYCVWSFDAAGPQRQLVYHTASWNAEFNHVSHCNAINAPAAQQYALGSGANRALAPRNNELCAFRLDGRLECVVIAPVLTDLNAPGGGNDYAKLPKASLDFAGEWACWTSNAGGAYLDAFLVRVPTDLLTAGPPTDPCTHACPAHCP